MEFKGHTYIKVRGDAETPARFWGVSLFTAAEYEKLQQPIKDITRRIKAADMSLIHLHFA